MSSEFKNLKVKQDKSVWTLQIHRPQALNALNQELLGEMGMFLRNLSEMNFENARALIITGAGEKAFVAGADIKEMSHLNSHEALSFAQRGQSVFQELSLLKIPVIAAVNGFALGGGCELALACDFILASENAKFGLPEVSLGLIPGFAGTVKLARAIGPARAKEIIFTGDMVTASEAFRLGLVSRVLPLSELIPTAEKIAETIASRGPIAIASAKKSLQQGWDLPMEEALKVEATYFSELFLSADVREGTQAFIEKRKAVFKGE